MIVRMGIQGIAVVFTMKLYSMHTRAKNCVEKLLTEM